MSELVFHALNLSAAATGALVSAIWEGSLVAALVFVTLRMFPRLSAAARSVIWLNVFILLALLHVLPVFTAAHLEAGAVGAHAVRLDPRWSLAVAALWAVCSLMRVAQLVWGAIHLRKMARNAVPVEPTAEVKPLLVHNGRAVALCVSDDVARPSVLGFFRPRVLVPPALLEQLPEADLKQVVLHEMEHLHRGDDWVNLLQKLALVLFPLNPALAWVERRLCTERELACDDRVLHSGSGRKAYALCLTRLAEFSLVRRGFSLVLGAWERRPELVRRVHRILSDPMQSMGRRPALAAMGGLTAGALACTLALAHMPQVVRFTPLTHTAEAQNMSTAVEAQEIGRELGGKPQFVKAVVPERRQQQNEPAKRCVIRRPTHKTPPPARLADLRIPPPPAPANQERTLLVMTQWTDSAVPQRVVIALQQAEQGQRQVEGNTQRPILQQRVILRTAYAVVRTPDGWLVIQI